MVNNAFPFRFKEARLSTTIGSDIKHTKFCGQVSTIMKVISNKDGDLLSQVDNINENGIPIPERILNLPPQIRDTPHQKMLINNHTDANKGKIKGYLYSEDVFGFCKSFKKLSKNLGFHLMLKTIDLQDIIYTSMNDDTNVTFNNLYLFIPNLLPSVETQLKFNEAIQNIDKISFDEYYTERQVISDMIVQNDIGSAQQVSSPKYLFCAHQTKDSTSAPDKKINIAIFDDLDLQKYHIELDNLRFPRDSLLISSEQNGCIEQNIFSKLFFKDYIGEPILNPFTSYPDIKTKYPFKKIDLGHQLDHIKPKKTQLFQEYGANLDNANFFLLVIRQREIELISDGNKLIEVKVL